MRAARGACARTDLSSRHDPRYPGRSPRCRVRPTSSRSKLPRRRRATGRAHCGRC